MNNSFGDSFNLRIQQLCEKYEAMVDEEDDLLNLDTLKVTTDHGKTKSMKRTVVGSIFTKKYKRKIKFEVQKYNYVGFDELYNGLFEDDFESIYNMIDR